MTLYAGDIINFSLINGFSVKTALSVILQIPNFSKIPLKLFSSIWPNFIEIEVGVLELSKMSQYQRQLWRVTHIVGRSDHFFDSTHH